MTKGEFSPVAVEEDGEKPKKGVDYKRILMIVAVIIMVIVVVALIIAVVVYFMQTEDSTTGTGMNYEPNIDRELVFEQGKVDNYKHYTNKLRELIREYEDENVSEENMVECDDGSPAPLGRFCNFNIEKLGVECTWQSDFGYDEGRPCIILSLDKREGWIPQITLNTTMPDEVRERYQPGYFPVSCEGVNQGDKENLGSVHYWPSEGFPSHFFPYLEQEGYMNPLVAVQFEKPEPSVVIMIKCNVWVDNLDASIDLTLLVD